MKQVKFVLNVSLFVFLNLGLSSCDKNDSKVEATAKSLDEGIFVVQWKREIAPKYGMPVAGEASDEKNVTYYVNGKFVGSGIEGIRNITEKIKESSSIWFFYDEPIINEIGPTWENTPEIFESHWDGIKNASRLKNAKLVIGKSIDAVFLRSSDGVEKARWISEMSPNE